MKIADLTNPTKNVNLDLKIIWDKSNPEEKWGHKIKTVIAVDIDAPDSKNSVMLDLFDGDIDKYHFNSKLRIINGYAKQSQNARQQFRVGYGSKDGNLVGHYEPID